MTSEPIDRLPGNPAGRPVFLVVDDDPMVRKIVTRGLMQLDPAEVLEEEDGLAAREVLRTRAVDVVVTDVVMPQLDGLALMKWAQEHRPGPLWIVLSGLDTFDAAVEALQLGAFDYLAKPPEVPRVRVAVRNALDQIKLKRERERLYAELEDSNVQLADKVDQLQQVCRVLESQAAVIQADLHRAETIQRALLPQDPPAIPGWCIETLYRPGHRVGGDFYDAVVLDDHLLGLVIADAAGHGVAAAMLSVLFKLRLKQRDRTGQVLQPGEVLRRLNYSLYDMLSASGAFITAAYILLDLRSGEGHIALAGHPPCLVGSDHRTPQRLERTGPALGLEEEPHYAQHTFSLEAGDRLMLYTDGILDGGPESPDTDSLAAGLAEVGDRAALLGGLFEDATRGLTGDRDDITLLLIQRCEGTSHFDGAAPARQQQAAEAPAPEPEPAEAPELPHLEQGAEDGHGFIAIVGSVTWLYSQALLDAASALLAGHDRLTLDLSRCEHLDSTCLGTLHEIVTSSPEALELQGVSDEVHKLFDELSMRVVLEHICPKARALPGDMTVVDTTSLSPQEQGARILSAHESLARLSESNRSQFQGVVDSLRSDLADAD
ncbi:SpoIIE family protein phosphatase [Parahaliea maris]|uniref:SpoIIE family protein phosphatase n=1 Tax=Parahaliea maris TaxID=2716870 RepID=A0A5C8ZTX8_9GAMM|nr:SpoIIE family protein phosphatase [Parahaliea maris]TXS91948.1 SpoIIE family protein phosphatase [Parahaliea maris]